MREQGNKAGSFVLYTDYADSLRKLPLDQIGAVFLAIFDYVEFEKMPENLDPVADMCFSFIIKQVQRDKEKYKEKCKKRAEAGRKGGEKKRDNLANAANATTAKRRVANLPDNDNEYDTDNDTEYDTDNENEYIAQPTQQQPPKKRGRPKKAKVPKVKYAEFVSMTEEEYQKLVDKYGPEKTARFIEALDNYKGSKGKTYESDYRAILSWVVKKVTEESSASDRAEGGSTADWRNFKPSTGFMGWT